MAHSAEQEVTANVKAYVDEVARLLEPGRGGSYEKSRYKLRTVNPDERPLEMFEGIKYAQWCIDRLKRGRYL